jgi:hypothetical protein
VIDERAGYFIEANDGSVWFRGDLGWYPLPLDSETYPIDYVPSGIAREIERPGLTPDGGAR